MPSSRRPNKVVALVGGAGAWCHPRTIPLVERAVASVGHEKKKKKKEEGAARGGGAEFRLLGRVVVASSHGSTADPAAADAAEEAIAILRASDADEAGRWADAIDMVGERERRRLISRPRPQRRSPQRGRPPHDAGMGDGRRGLDCASLPSGTATADRPRVDCGSQTVDLGIGLAASEGLFDREEEGEEEMGGCTESSEAGGDTAGEDEDGKTTTTTTTAAAGEEEKEGADGGPKPKDDPKYEKYRRMTRMGLPKEAARHAMIRDNLDPRCVRSTYRWVGCLRGVPRPAFYFDILALFFTNRHFPLFGQHLGFGSGGAATRKPTSSFFRRWTRRWERRRCGSRRGL